MPPRYREWREAAEFEILSQLAKVDTPIAFPVAITMEFRGKHRATVDIDNAAGAVLDALVASNVLTDDRLKFIPKLILEHLPSFKDVGIFIEINSI